MRCSAEEQQRYDLQVRRWAGSGCSHSSGEICGSGARCRLPSEHDFFKTVLDLHHKYDLQVSRQEQCRSSRICTWGREEHVGEGGAQRSL